MCQDKVCLKKRIMLEDTYTFQVHGIPEEEEIDDQFTYYLINSVNTCNTIIL